MSFTFKKKVFPPHLGTISRRRVVGGLLVAAAPLSWVVALGSPLHTQVAPALPQAAGTWTSTGSLQTTRGGHTATLLSNGKVLVAGEEFASSTLISAELYDPASGTWTATGSMTQGRWHHTATLLQSGKVLVVGGVADDDPHLLASAELYDSSTGTWTATGSMQTHRFFHTATLLSTGKVLVVGGAVGSGTEAASAELYDPATGTWTPTGSMQTARSAHVATLLSNGKVLVAGSGFSGPTLASAELYDPETGTWTPTGSMQTAREFHTATLLSNGQVLVAGGGFSGPPLASAELYDPASGTWTLTDSLHQARFQHTATLLSNGKVLVAGGELSFVSTLSSAELYDPLALPVPTFNGTYQGLATSDTPNGGVTRITLQVTQSGQTLSGTLTFLAPTAITGSIRPDGSVVIQASNHNFTFTGSQDSPGHFSGTYVSASAKNRSGSWTLDQV